ncbi:MAG: DNA cytosine methyltransferase [Bacteroidales bacterium]|nr:DNA cytosine methyltransferase [Bacteroidales bacterium]
MSNKKFRFVDLFCGIGGFHQAMTKFGGECVFAAEIDPDCIDTYYKNYGIDAAHDMTQIDVERVPEHEVLCAGFPCQAFSKAGKQAGINDTRGTLFFEIERLLRYHHTPFILLENVRNLVSHDQGRTWQIITDVLHDIGYRLTTEPLILSPHQFGVPQLRERVYIVGVYDPENVKTPLDISFSNLLSKTDLSIYSVLENEKPEGQDSTISDQELLVLQAWDEFYQGIKEKVIGFPINVEYFNWTDDISYLPEWKQQHIVKNRQLYANNREFINKWLEDWDGLKSFTPTQRKLEWQCGTGVNTIFEGIIQMRPSGIRVKLPNVFPALVAMVQIPIIGRYKRRLTVRECARLQSFPDSFRPCANRHQALKQFGNSVNVNVLEAIFTQLDSKYGPIRLKPNRLEISSKTAYRAAPLAVQLSLFESQVIYQSRKDCTFLIATCRQGNKQWILDNMLYNYPITEDEIASHPELMGAKRLMLLHRKKFLGFFEVSKAEIVDLQWLKDHKYPVNKRHKANSYLLYHLRAEEPPLPQDIRREDFIIFFGKGVKNETEEKETSN